MDMSVDEDIECRGIFGGFRPNPLKMDMSVDDDIEC